MAATHNAENERIKRRYALYLADANGASGATVNSALAALTRFEAATGHRPFRAFHIEQARAFKRKLLETKSAAGVPLSLATAHHVCKALEAFFVWLASEPGFRSRLKHGDARYFRLNGNQVTAATSPRPEKPVPTIAQIERVLSAMPGETNIQRRDRALVAAALVTGARDGALRTAQLRHVDLTDGVFQNDGRAMNVKFGKVFPTWFFPVSELALTIFKEWVMDARDKLLFGETDPLFPATLVARNAASGLFEPTGLTRDFWADANPIREIFRRAFNAAGLPYANPHSFRKTLAEEGRRRHGNDVERFQAWAQNLGHESLLTTLTSYGKIAPARQAAIIRASAGAAGQGDEPISDALRQRVLADLVAQHQVDRRNEGGR